MRAAQLAEMALLGGNVVDAESILLQNGLVFRAVMVNLHTHNWTRSVEMHCSLHKCDSLFDCCIGLFDLLYSVMNGYPTAVTHVLEF